MCVDMLIISILKETSSGEGGQKVKLMTETQLDQIVLNAKKIVEDSVVVYPEIVATVIREINHTIFLSS